MNLFDTKMSAIADETRRLTSTKGSLSLDDIVNKLSKVELEGGGGIDTSDATASAEEILKGETAYGPEGKITGTFTIEDELTEQDDLISQIAVALKGKMTGGVDIDAELATQDDLITQIQTTLNHKLTEYQRRF